MAAWEGWGSGSRERRVTKVHEETCGGDTDVHDIIDCGDAFMGALVCPNSSLLFFKYVSPVVFIN